MKQASTYADPEDSLKDCYGDLPLVQSQGISGKKWQRVEAISPVLTGEKACGRVSVQVKQRSRAVRHWTSCMQVLLRARVHTVRGKGKSAFLVLRQRHATIQVGALPTKCVRAAGAC